MQVRDHFGAGNFARSIAFGVIGSATCNDARSRGRGILRRSRIVYAVGFAHVFIVTADVDAEHLQQASQSFLHADLFYSDHRTVYVRCSVRVIQADDSGIAAVLQRIERQFQAKVGIDQQAVYFVACQQSHYVAQTYSDVQAQADVLCGIAGVFYYRAEVLDVRAQYFAEYRADHLGKVYRAFAENGVFRIERNYRIQAEYDVVIVHRGGIQVIISRIQQSARHHARFRIGFPYEVRIFLRRQIDGDLT